MVGRRGAGALDKPATGQVTPVPRRCLTKGKFCNIAGKDLRWSEMTVDSPVVAHRAIISGPDHVWIATDTGMILQLATE